ncbi:MAG TPA: PilC/PilY family type IV pilus protein, partial [Patescibacteria group bacterium]|nr:PilC/PilY family type IV pilus protein [Patescibacteria group bacterium]
MRIEGLSPTDYNGWYATITKAGNKAFTYTPAITLGPVSPAGGTITAAASNPAFTISPLVRSGGTVTGTTSAAHGWVAGDSIVISGANEAAYNGTFPLVTVPTTTTFTFAIATGPATPAGGSITATRSGGVNKNELINWVRGENRLFEDNPSGNAAHIRGYHHGDVLHSRPAVVNYGRTNDNRDILVFYGANDGMLHAVKGGRDTADGLEKWAYIAEDHFPALKDLYTASPSILTTPRRYFFDGPTSVYQNDADGDGALEGGAEKVWLYAAMRRGGRGIHALDVSSPGTNLDVAPTLLWRKSSADVAGGYAELGQSWSEVQPVKVAAQSNPAVVFALGYDDAANDPTAPGTASSRQSAATMGRGVMVADAATGNPIWVATPNASYALSTGVHLQVATMTCAIASDVAAVDIDLNGLVDRLYVADTCANIWRIDVGSADVADWTVRKLASLGGSGTALRKFLFRPDVVRLPNEPAQLAILVGSGDREAPFDTTVQNAFYMVKDNVDSNCPNCGVISGGVTSDGLCERNTLTNTTAVTACTTSCSGQTAIDPATGLTCFQACLTARTACAIDHDGDPNTAPLAVADRGWKYTYPTTGEKTVNAPLTVGGTAFFGTNIPQSLVNA